MQFGNISNAVDNNKNTIHSALNIDRNIAELEGAERTPQLNPSERRLAEIAQIRRVKAGEIIYLECDSAQWVYQVVNGTIREFNIMEDGRRQVVDFYSTGEFFGLSEDPSYSHSAEAIQDSIIRCYPMETYINIITNEPRLAKGLLSTVVQRLHRARERMILLGRMGALQKVASFLLNLLKSQGNDNDLHLAMSRQDIADYLGLTIETVCRSFTQLKNEGVIVMNSARELHITNTSRLKAICDGNSE